MAGRKRTTFGWRGWMAISAVLMASWNAAAVTNTPMGLTRIVCADAPAQSYMLYVPASASATASPILYGFDPGGNGLGTAQLLTSVAAENGWILAVSNNSKNGPWADIFAAQDAMIRDTEARLSLHPTRRFATGFSGGARASLALAFRYPEKVCGVLCLGAGWPVNTSLEPSTDRLMVKILIGTQDSNYLYDIPNTQGRLTQAGIACRVETYNAGHVWPPTAQVAAAARWLNENAEKDLNANLPPVNTTLWSSFAQLPSPPTHDSWFTGRSDSLSGELLADNFEGVTRPITRIEWWGLAGKYDSYAGGYWLPAPLASNTYTVRFYTEAGDLFREETVTATATELPGQYLNNYPLMRFNAAFASPVNLSAGWVSIEHVLSSGTVSLWLSSNQGDGFSGVDYYGIGDFFPQTGDMAFALGTERLVCDFQVDAAWGELPHQVQFYGTATGDLGEPVSWHWDFGDGTTLDGQQNPVHEYLDEGQYTVTLTTTTPNQTATAMRGNYIVAAYSLPLFPGWNLLWPLGVLGGAGVLRAMRRR